jgi:lysyl endopeptidase
MKRYPKIIVTLYFSVLVVISSHSLPIYGQLSRPGNPVAVAYQGAPKISIYEVPLPEIMKLKTQVSNGQIPLKPASSGTMIDVDYNPMKEGIWDTLSNGFRIWRAAFHAKDVSLMNVVFSPYRLNKGVKIFLYDPGRKTILGAFTDINNKSVNLLATAFLPGDILIVEMQVPGYLTSFGELAIAGIGCDFSETGGKGQLKDGWYGTAGTCNVDINCLDDSVYQTLKNAVVRIVYDGGERCTGTLLNNTRKDGINYVITAEHCISSEASANGAVFYFDYESPWCEGPDGSIAKSVSGATLRATGNNLDFSLLELLEPVPFTYKPYYAGWDISGYAPASGYSIHHPFGDVKKISREEHPLLVTNFGQGYDVNTHWLVRHWESGTTEAGSSGAAFLDSYNRLIGTLTGGMATCEDPVNDYFQMFSHCWDDYPDQRNQLAYWLDPLYIQPEYLDGFDPYRDFWLTGDTLSNITAEESLVLESGDLTWGSYSGHNADYLTGFAERFKLDAGKRMMGLMLQVAHNFVATPDSKMNIMVWEGESVPGNVLYQKEFSLADLAGENQNFVEFDSIISTGSTFFTGYQLQYVAPQDTFSTYMASNRQTDHYNTAYVYNGHQWQSLADYTLGGIYSSFAIMPVVFDTLPDEIYKPDFTDDVINYPNPTSSFIWLEFRELSPYTVEVTLMNAQGQIMMEKEFGPYQHTIRLEHLDLNTGIYLIRIKQGDIIHNLKATIVK